MEKSQTFLEKHRPTQLSQIAGNELILKILTNFTKRGEFPHLLLHGQPGTGKTTCATNVAREVCGRLPSPNVLELNASDDRGINVIRDQVSTFVSTEVNFFTKNKQKLKIVILDEADSMTKTAQFALRRLIEVYSKKVRFILICNDVFKIIGALKSRCVGLKFKPIPKTEVLKLLKNILSKEQKIISEDRLVTISEHYNGDLRKSLSELQIELYSKTSINYESMDNHIKSWFNKCKAHSIKEAYEGLKGLTQEYGVSLIDVIKVVLNALFERNKVAGFSKEETFGEEEFKGVEEIVELTRLENIVIELGEDNKMQMLSLVSIINKINRI
eukprot:GAHX01000737.1.p1 GENE.GAHX01000737.1~~GAHX01000737.1.p1  ORF type:complete len:329 (-),score=61.13 GAHX01000737.1:9-995(-)